MKTVKLLTLDGYVEVRAESHGLFLVHRALLETGISGKTWTVTHEMTGRAIAHFKIKAPAKEAARAFDALFEMYQIEDDLKSWLQSVAFCQLGNVILDGLDRLEDRYSNGVIKEEKERWKNDRT